MPTSNDIRATFLDYFAAHAHTVVESSSLVPRNDPTLLFTNSGMVQFKNVFTGAESRPYTRATSAQKCVRAGGKHNDLDNVGYTARHHTFFEMLGNFSFGDYFKAEAIEHAWTLCTREFHLPPEKLLVTVYHDDTEAADLWRRIAKLPDHRIIRIATNDNFWRMADTGPCGPSSEIFYDHGDHIAGGPPGSAQEDGDRFVEIWNLVFMQYDETEPGTRIPLPHPSIDTGMGLERVAAILQGKHDNYDTDTFRALIEASAELTHQPPDGPQRASHRVIADHVRSSAFLMADGVLPSNEGRGYVLRRIMRRAMRHAHMMGAREPVMDRLVPVLTRQMGAAYPELIAAEPLIRETLRLEETRFSQLLTRGMGLLTEELTKLSATATLPGDIAFRLYDTYGFPLDLTQDALREQGRAVDLAGFQSAMAEQRRRARAAWSGSGEAGPEAIWFELRERLGATEFLGYATQTTGAEITAIVIGGMAVEHADAGEHVTILLNQTPFYAESGGQVGDTGTITSPDGLAITITDTQKKPGALFAHIGHIAAGTARVGQPVTAAIDPARRAAIAAHHSATHLLHAALRIRLGPHVTQKGSLNAPDRLRFDVSQPRPITPAELAQVEADVNAQIRANTAVTTRLMTPEAAVAEGAMALFGEKYGDEVRVVSMGTMRDNGSTQATSVELCGGTHAPRTGHIGLFRITSESAVAAGIRRIEALTGAPALAHIAQSDARLSEIASLLKTPQSEAPARITNLLEDKRRLERQLAEAQTKLALAAADAPLEIIAGIQLAARNLGEVPAKDLKPIAEALRKQLGSGVVALVSTAEGKASVIVAITPDLLPRHDAITLARAASAALGGKGGGGKPDLAQAGGPDPTQAEAALVAIRAALASP